MPGGQEPGPSVKDDELYEKLRDEGNSKEKSARIANASANQSRSTTGRKGGESGSSVVAQGVDELVDALRNH